MSLIPIRGRRQSGTELAGFSSLADFRTEMNRLFDGLFSRPFAMQPWLESPAQGQWLPAIDMSDDPQNIRVRAELPGIDPKHVDVEVTEDRLVISGEKAQSATKGGDGWSHVESQYGGFCRTIPLPDPVDPAKVTASFDNGVLTVELAKTATHASRKVPVLAK